MKIVSGAGVVAGLAMLGAIAPAHAQEVGQKTAAGPATPLSTVSQSPSDAGLDEIIVTANRRSENAQRVPVSVTAIGSDLLARRQAVTLVDANGIAPNVQLQTSPGFGSVTAFTIRGVGQADPEISFEPPVGVLVDGVFLGRASGAVQNIRDAAQIEVLRGPQGALFGKNTTGGAISISSRRPGGDFSGLAEVGYGKRNELNTLLSVEGPVLGDALSVRALYSHNSEDGYVTDTVTGKSHGDTDVDTFKIVALSRPSPNLELLATAQFDRDRSGSASPKNVTTPGGVAPLSGGPIIPVIFPGGNTQLLCSPPPFGLSECFDGNIDRSSYSIPDKFHSNSYLGTATVDWRLPGVRLTSVTGYWNVKDAAAQDFDATASQLFGHNLADVFRDQTYHQFSEEVRAASDTSGRAFQYVAGLYYFTSEYRLNQRADIATPVPHPPFNYVNIAHQILHNYAVFGQASYALTDKLKATLGGRLGRESKDFDGVAQDTIVITPRKFRSDTFSPRGSLSYQLDPQILVFASAARGFKSGGFNGRPTSIQSVGPFKDERVDTYELGLKSELFDRRLRLNISGFSSNFRNKQEQINLVNSVTTQPEIFIENVGSVRIDGVEVEGDWRPSQRFDLAFNAGYQNARYTSFCAFLGRRPTSSNGIGTPCGPADAAGEVPTDNSDLRLKLVPKFSARIEPTYNVRFEGGGKATASIAWTHTSSEDTNVQNFAFGRRPRTDVFDANITFTTANEALTLSLYGRNLSNERYILLSQNVAILDDIAYFNRPRSYGASVRYRF